MADDVTFFDVIEGYCSPLSVEAGDGRPAVHVSTEAATFDIKVERWGAHRETAWQASGLPSTYTPAPPQADSNGCGWPATIDIPVDEGWATGFYLVTLTAVGGPTARATAYAGFVVRAPAANRQRAILVLGTNTWNAYNTWGGASLYTGGHTVSFERPFNRGALCRAEVERDDRKARPVRWGEAADADGEIFQAYRAEHGYTPAIGSSGWFTHERRFVEWAEAAGYKFDYAVSADLDDDQNALDDYDLVLSVGHDEYWSRGHRDTVERHIQGGGHLAALSGNTMFWQVRLEGGAMVCHKYAAQHNDPVVATGESQRMSGMFADPLVGDPEWKILGAGSAFGLYHRFGQATPLGVGGFVIYRHNHWLLAGTGLVYGDVLGAMYGVVGYETMGCRISFDDYQLPVAAPFVDMPAQVEIVAFTPSSNLGVGDYPKSISAKSDQGDLEFIAERIFGGTDQAARAKARYGNSVMLTCRPFGETGGEVVTIGTTDWVFGLRGDPAVARVTKNILDRYLGAGAGAPS